MILTGRAARVLRRKIFYRCERVYFKQERGKGKKKRRGGRLVQQVSLGDSW